MSTRCYDTDLNDAAWAWIAPYLPAARSGGRPRTTDLRAVLNAIFYLLRTGCQWRLLPREFPRPGTVYHYFRAWKDAGVLAELQRALHEQARLSRGRLPCPSVVILDSQPVKTTERGGTRGFGGHKRVKTAIQARGDALPKSALAKACNYTLTLWQRLIRFLDYPGVELSNNLAENAIRPVALGRRNWIHIGSKEAGPRVAAIISVVETCRLKIPVRDYL